jgi:hypothetical protein
LGVRLRVQEPVARQTDSQTDRNRYSDSDGFAHRNPPCRDGLGEAGLGFAVSDIVRISALRDQQSSIANSHSSLAHARIASKRIWLALLRVVICPSSLAIARVLRCDRIAPALTCRSARATFPLAGFRCRIFDTALRQQAQQAAKPTSSEI